MKIERKGGVTFLAILLGVAATNVLLEAVYLSQSDQFGDVIYHALMILSSVLAGVSCYGLWALKGWSFYTFIACVTAFLSAAILLQVNELVMSWELFLGLFVANILLWYFVSIYIRNNLKPRSNEMT